MNLFRGHGFDAHRVAGLVPRGSDLMSECWPIRFKTLEQRAHPDWYENLVAQPVVQVMADRFWARARPATAAEKPALWKTMTAVWPAYDEYQTRTTREIPVVIIERA